MSKRSMFPQDYSERKKAKLDVSVTEHNFPLSQNAGHNKDENTWGDENDDEILLLASQACEAYTNDISSLPDYSMCMQPGSTSTQIQDPGPSTSKAFSFKKPTSYLPTFPTPNKQHRISSPLPGMSNMSKDEPLNNDDLLFNDKVYKHQDSQYLYKQLLQLQEDNQKLKSENGKLQEKCVTKEGEASILRTQLKTCQIAVDNARMEKIKAQEKVQMEFNDKLNAVNNQMQDLKTQLDFKNLEIISAKEKCKMLESSKVKLTQVTVAQSDGHANHKTNNNFHTNHESFTQARKVKHTSCSAQTDNKSLFVKLQRNTKPAKTKEKHLLPTITQPSIDTNYSILDYNDKLQWQTEFSQNKCRIFSTFHKLPSTPGCKEKRGGHIRYEDVLQDVLFLIENGDNTEDRFFRIWRTVEKSLEQVTCDLEAINKRLTTVFQREMDEKYIEASTTYTIVKGIDLIGPRSLYKDEQACIPRRITALLCYVISSLKSSKYLEVMLRNGEKTQDTNNMDLISIVLKIGNLLEATSCTILYTGLLLSIIKLLKNITKQNRNKEISVKILKVLKSLITSRPNTTAVGRLLSLMCYMNKDDIGKMCHRNSNGNLKIDNDQGVLLYKKDMCTLQIFLRQIEAMLNCIDKQQLIYEAAKMTNRLLKFYYNTLNLTHEKNKCNCQSVLCQVLVYSLQICATMLKDIQNTGSIHIQYLQSICRAGVTVLYQWLLRDIEFSSRLSYSEGHYYMFVECCEDMHGDIAKDDIQGNMLTELVSTLQPSIEDIELPNTSNKEVWLNSFTNFTITD